MTTQKKQTIEWYNYWWTLKPIYNVTIENVTTDESGNLIGLWKDDGGTIHSMTKSPADSMWRFK